MCVRLNEMHTEHNTIYYKVDCFKTVCVKVAGESVWSTNERYKSIHIYAVITYEYHRHKSLYYSVDFESYKCNTTVFDISRKPSSISLFYYYYYVLYR